MTEEQKNNLVVHAKKLLGTPYRYGAAPEDAPGAFDCSSFTQYLFASVGIEIPRSAILQAGDANGKELTIGGEFLPGDLLFMRSDVGHYKDGLFNGRKIDIGHVVLFVGDGMILHAKSDAGGVIEQPLAELVADPAYGIVYAKRF